MPASVTWEGLRELAAFHAENGCAISLHLNLDPHVSPTPAEANARARSLLDLAAKRGEADRTDLTHDQKGALKADLDRIRRFVELELDRGGAHGFVLFAASLDNFWRPIALTAPVPDEVKLATELYLTPLVPLVESGEGALVAHVGRERGDVYRLQSGRLVEIADRSEEQPRRHDQGGWSQANYQRHVDSLAHDHLRVVADELDRRRRSLGARHVVIACTDELKAELGGLLAPDVRNIAVWTHAEAHASPSDLLALVAPLLENWRAEREGTAVDRWREEAARDGRAAAGWGQTLEAASDGRVELLLYQPGADRPAWRCPACARLQPDDGKCPLDGTELEWHEEGLDLAVHQTLAHGGTALLVSARRDLDPVGGVGALLRY